MRVSLVFRVSFVYACLVLLNVSVLLVMIFENQLDLIAENASLQSRFLGTRLGASLADGGLSVLDEELFELLGISGLVIYDDSGAVRSELRPVTLEVSPRDALRNVGMALARRDFAYRSFYHDLDYERRTVSIYVPFTADVEGTSVVRADVPLEQIDRSLSYLYRQAAIVVFVVVLLHAVWAVYLYQTVLRPMKRIVAATEQVSRGNFKIRVPVVKRNEFGRLASAFNEMSVAVSRIHDEALHSNPLTGLPGNPAIYGEIEARINDSFAVMYADLDNFKAYNDHYGFSQGDVALLYTRDRLVESTDALPGSFVGHEGGDDFVVVTDADSAESLAKTIIASFERDRRSLFSDGDWRRGYIDGRDRNGNDQVFPLLSVSVAVILDHGGRFQSPEEVIAAVAGVKQRAKQLEGSGFVIDRRGEAESA